MYAIVFIGNAYFRHGNLLIKKEGTLMDKNIIKALASELAKKIKNEKDLNQFSSLLKNSPSNVELYEHLRHDKYY
ncbi:FPC/CPF motif-containing protein YcgG [Providencia alcalifaciens]|nr:FPC/CPF motif-containing protein YcgG [Providencia alcalifaciens]